MTVTCHVPCMCWRRSLYCRVTLWEHYLYITYATIRIQFPICGCVCAPTRWTSMMKGCSLSSQRMEQQTWRQRDVKQGSGFGCGAYATSCTWLCSKVGKQCNPTRISFLELRSLWSICTRVLNSGQHLRTVRLQFLWQTQDLKALAPMD